jgi:hypothetical protein
LDLDSIDGPYLVAIGVYDCGSIGSVA